MSIRDDFFAAKAKGSLWDVAVSIKRGNPLPLDADSIFESYAALEAYANDVLAYPGQVVAVVNADSTGIYYLDQNLAIKPVGVIPTGDGKSIEVTADGVISLAGVDKADSLTLPRMKEDKSGIEWVPVSAVVQGDGNDNTTYEITALTKGEGDAAETYGIKVKTLFNGTAVEGGEFTIDFDVYTKSEANDKFLAKADYKTYDDTALAARVKKLEDNPYDDTELTGRVSDLEGVVGNTENGLVKDLADEVARATEAERLLGERIDGIDFVDADELADAIKDFATVNYVDGEIDKIEEAISNLNHFTATIVDSIDEVKDIGVLYLIKDEDVVGVDKYNEYIVVDGAPILIGDTTTDLSNYYNKTAINGKVETLEGAIADEVDAREALADRVEVLEGKPFDTYATKSEVETVNGKFANYTTTTDLNTALDGKYDKNDHIYFETATEYGSSWSNIVNYWQDGAAIFAGEGLKVEYNDAFEGYDATFYQRNAITQITDTDEREIRLTLNLPKATEQFNGDRTIATVEDIDTKLADYATTSNLTEAVEDIENDLLAYAKIEDVDAELAKKIETGSITHSSDTLAEGVTVDGTKLNIVVDAYTKQEVRDYVADVIEDMTGGESAADVLLALNNHIATYEEKVGQIDTKNAAQDAAITEAKNQADKGVTDAAAADAKATVNAEEIGKHATRIGTLETARGDHETRIGTLESKESTHASEYTVLKGRVDDHDTAIGGKADQSALSAVSAKVGANEQAIKVLNETTIPGINEAIAGKANSADVYTKTDIGAIAEGKTLVKMIEEAAAAGTTAVSELANGAVKTNTEAIAAIYTPASGEGENLVAASGVLVDLVKAEETRAKAAEQVNADAIAIINGNDAGKSMRTVAGEEALKIVNGAPEAYDTLKEVADWIANDQSGAASMAANIAKNTEAIAAIYSVDAEGKASGTLVSEIARVEGKADANTQAIAAINNTETGIAAVAKKYTDDTMVKADEASIENKNGTFSVKKVSVDILDDTGIELILNAGDSGYKAPEVSE